MKTLTTRASSLLSFCSEATLELLFPRKCGLCGLLGDLVICAKCRADFAPSALPVGGKSDSLDASFTIFAYEGRAAQAVRRLKYSRITPLGDVLAEEIAVFACDYNLLEHDLVVPVPIHWRRRFYRGFNQAELLCFRMPQNKVHTNLLRRIRATHPQVGLTPIQRQTNLVGAFEAASLAGASVLLVDDVMTTGGTARECARALKEAGVMQVTALALCGESQG